MIVRGSATLAAPPDAVFAAICDPGALLEVIPGCQEIEQVADDEYRGRIALRLPAIVGTFDTVVRLVEARPPFSGVLEGRLDGRVGGLAGRATFRLEARDGGTVVEYDGSGTVRGPLARLDSRFLEGFARSLVNEGLARLGRRLQAVPTGAVAR
ncbi:MAG TPA: carbon monoxide dehydrogenase subunit G [Candidatus Sulfotelmatobacter sp.]|nr:carbon monoxide dehydrogenase subunit G [Candidatus Sulfotelmatobacter sp.]